MAQRDSFALEIGAPLEQVGRLAGQQHFHQQQAGQFEEHDEMDAGQGQPHRIAEAAARQQFAPFACRAAALPLELHDGQQEGAGGVDASPGEPGEQAGTTNQSRQGAPHLLHRRRRAERGLGIHLEQHAVEQRLEPPHQHAEPHRRPPQQRRQGQRKQAPGSEPRTVDRAAPLAQHHQTQVERLPAGTAARLDGEILKRHCAPCRQAGGRRARPASRPRRGHT